MEGIHGTGSFDVHQRFQAISNSGLRLFKCRVGGGDGSRRLLGEVNCHGRGNDEVTVGESLHESGGSKAVGSVIREVGFAQNMESREVGHEIVVDPKPAHGVVDGRVNFHRNLVGIVPGNLLVHLEEVSVSGANGVFAIPLDGICEVEEDSQPC